MSRGQVGGQVGELAAALAGVCFAPAGASSDPASLQLVGDALADAVETLLARFDDLDVELVRACDGLLREVRTLGGDRVRCGAAAEALFRHAAVAATDDPEGYAPLLRVLAALAVLPTAEDIDLSLDPRPDPGLPVEVALAGTSSAAVDAAVHDATFHAPVLDLTAEDVEGRHDIGVQFVPVVIDGTPCISVFTSAERVAYHVRRAGLPVDAVPVVELAGTELAELCPPGHAVAINPGMVLGHTFRPVSARATNDAVAASDPGRPAPTPVASSGRRAR